MSRFFKEIESGFLFNAEPGTDHAVAAGPRCVVTGKDEIVCSFMVQSGLGINDFKPVLLRSKDGRNWHSPVFLWEHLTRRYSIFGSISRSPDGQLFFFGTRTKIDFPGESFWSEKTQGLKDNELVYAYSSDNGHTWSEPFIIPKPISGSAEAAGAMCITKTGSWHICYSPYNTFDPNLFVERNQVVLLTSRDRGKNWSYAKMMNFDEPYASAAEAWIIELSDGRLFGTCWKINNKDDTDFPNPYTISYDDGKTWTHPESTGIKGQTPSVTPLPDGRILFIYNQRKIAPCGIRLAVAKPSENKFEIEIDEPVYMAERPSIKESATTHSDWTSFTFGEPQITILPDKTLLVVFWCIEPKKAGIRYIRLNAGNLD